MQKLVSITRQGQMTVPKAIREALGIKGSVKALLKKEGKILIVKPKSDFWSLSGSLKSHVRMSSQNLKKARQAFSKKWPRKS